MYGITLNGMGQWFSQVLENIMMTAKKEQEIYHKSLKEQIGDLMHIIL